MPVMHFRVRWPDETETSCYSPSTVVADFFAAGERYPVAEFVERSRQALGIASERVREKFGFACSAAMDQLEQILSLAARFADRPDATVTVIELI